MPRNSSLYGYSPSVGAAAIAAIIMCTVFLFLLVRTIKMRAWVSLVMIFAAASKFGIIFNHTIGSHTSSEWIWSRVQGVLDQKP